MNLKQVINASGRMSILGVSTLSDVVLDGMAYGGKHYFEMEDLVTQSGQAVAGMLGTEAALIVNSASAGIALSIAGAIAKDKHQLVENIYAPAPQVQREILLMKGHNVDYGAPVETMIRLGGGIPVEAGYANGCRLEQLEQSISEQTAAVLFIQSHHAVQKNMPALDDVYALCQRYNVPLILDAAAEDHPQSYSERADVVIFSGSKALEGPTSGILAGKKTYVSYAAQHQKGIGRAMKVGKEAIFGLLAALQHYDARPRPAREQQEELMKLQELEAIPGVRVTIEQDEAGRPIYRGRIHVDEQEAACNALTLVARLKEGNLAVYTRDYHANEGSIDLDLRPLQAGDLEKIIAKVKQILGGA